MAQKMLVDVLQKDAPKAWSKGGNGLVHSPRKGSEDY